MTDPRPLEARLLDLGTHLDVPPAPPLRQAVAMSIAAAPVRAHTAPWSVRFRARRPWAMTAGALVAVAAAVVLALPAPRTAVAHWLGIARVEVRPVQTLPPVPSPTTAADVEATLGRSIPLARVEQLAGFRVLLPAALGAPDRVYVRDDLHGAVSLVYRARPGLPATAATPGVGLLVTELRAGVEGGFLLKLVGPSASVLPVTVDGTAGYWITGAAHEVGYDLPDGSIAPDSLRLSGPALLWQRGPLSLRIEGDLTQAQALALAASFG